MGLLGLGLRWGIILQALAIVHFVRRRPDGFWLWVILIGGGLGALVYMAAEVLPDLGLLRASFAGVSRRRRVHDLEAVVRENPAVGNLEELADLCYEEGQYARARELYDRVITPRTDTVDPYYRRALVLLALHEPALAAADLEVVVAKDRKYDIKRAIGLLAHACGLAGQTDRADQLFREATEMTTLTETSLNYASFLAAHQRPADARAWLQKILASKATMPRYQQRRERPWFRQAAALLKKLPPA